MDEVVEALEKYQGLVPLVYDIETMSLDEARSEDMQYAVYLKREADKMIAHQKYKRCLAMAMWCDEAYHRECGLNPEEMTDKEFYKQQIEFWPRWSSRWLAIAEKFKEAK